MNSVKSCEIRRVPLCVRFFSKIAVSMSLSGASHLMGKMSMCKT